MPDQKPTLEYETPPARVKRFSIDWANLDRFAAVIWVLAAVVIILSMSCFLAGLLSK